MQKQKKFHLNVVLGSFLGLINVDVTSTTNDKNNE